MFEERRHHALAVIRQRRELIDKGPRSHPGWSQASPTPENAAPAGEANASKNRGRVMHSSV